MAHPSHGPAPAAVPDPARVSALHEALEAWYASHRRDLPWRAPGVDAYGVLVSEVMLQQTPVRRVDPAWRTWLERWPTPADLAAASPADVVRAWGRLGYPRRALRLRDCAREIVARHDGHVPRSPADLRALPGVGAYTAAAVSVFAHGDRAAVLDTNVRRVLARALDAQEAPPPGPTRAEVHRAETLLPAAAPAAAVWSVAVMELGALVCTARSPACGACPLAASCAWRGAGFPSSGTAGRRRQAWRGTDRQARGRLLGLLRDAAVDAPVPEADLAAAWPPDEQRERALRSLLADGLVEQTPAGLRLPPG